jgi:hypothetical protein
MPISRLWLSIWRHSIGWHRFLREPFFSGGLESLKAILIVESPSAFRRRLIFISADGISRPHRSFAASGSAPALS